MRTLGCFLIASILLVGFVCTGCAGDSSSGNGSGTAGAGESTGATGGSGSSGSSGSSGEPTDAGPAPICAICDKAVRCCFAQEVVDAGDCPGYSTATCESQIPSEQHENVLFCTFLLGLGAEAGIPACL